MGFAYKNFGSDLENIPNYTVVLLSESEYHDKYLYIFII